MAEFTADKETMLKSHDEILRGNGEVGLRADVKANTGDLSIIKDDIRWGRRLIFGTLILQLINIAMNSGV